MLCRPFHKDQMHANSQLKIVENTKDFSYNTTVSGKTYTFNAYIIICVLFCLPTFTKHTTCPLPPPTASVKRGRWLSGYMYNGHA
jgi:hypothetical protein